MAETKPSPTNFVAILMDDSTQIELTIDGFTRKISNKDLSEYPSIYNPDIDPNPESLLFFNGVTVLPYSRTKFAPFAIKGAYNDRLTNPRIIVLATDAGTIIKGIRMKIYGKHGIINEHIHLPATFMKQSTPSGGYIIHKLEAHLYTIGDEVITEAMIPAGSSELRNALIFAPTMPVILELPKNLLAKFKQVAYFGEKFWQNLKPSMGNKGNPWELPYDEIDGENYYLWDREQRSDIFANPESSVNSRVVFGYDFWKNYWSRQSLSEKEQKWFNQVDPNGYA